MPHEPFTLGAYEVTPLCDGWAPLPLSDEVPDVDVDWDRQRSLFPWAFPTDDVGSWAWHVHAFLIGHPDGAVLVDTGIGHLGRTPYDVTGRIEDELAELGISPGDVGHVVLTHLHGDHAGGACLPDGTPRFPNARYHVHPDDWSFFGEHRTPDDFTGRFAMARLDEVGMLDLEPSDHDVLPEVSLLHTPGHTPGHRAVRLDDGNDTLVLVGDLLHVPPQIGDPTAPSNHDEDPALASRSRANLIEAALTEGWAVGVSHFARAFGRVRPEGWSPV